MFGARRWPVWAVRPPSPMVPVLRSRGKPARWAIPATLEARPKRQLLVPAIPHNPSCEQSQGKGSAGNCSDGGNWVPFDPASDVVYALFGSELGSARGALHVTIGIIPAVFHTSGNLAGLVSNVGHLASRIFN